MRPSGRVGETPSRPIKPDSAHKSSEKRLAPAIAEPMPRRAASLREPSACSRVRLPKGPSTRRHWESRMTGRAVLPLVAAALFAAAGISPALAQALVERNVVLVDSISMRVVDILHGGAGP